MSKTERTTSLAGHSVDYQVRHSEDATEPRIDVDIHGVQITLPEESDEDPERLLNENANWVLERKLKYERYREQAPDRMFEPDEEFPYLGEDRAIVVEPRGSHSVDEESIRLRKSTVDQSSLRRVLENFYRSRAREYLTDRADHFADEMGVEYDRIELRNQRTRWGSCSTNGALSLNWRLVMAPRGPIDYVIVHELAHLVESDHNREFWRIVGKQLPDYKEHADWLDKNSIKLVFSEDDI
ncbi:M48 family metallopeptidase [Halosimplex marinum]|uniref:M48 family metallopeptidase n=1 Tax=Halosimplex marinum TaxID=3396620 RepID=UPI003F558E71